MRCTSENHRVSTPKHSHRPPQRLPRMRESPPPIHRAKESRKGESCKESGRASLEFPDHPEENPLVILIHPPKKTARTPRRVRHPFKTRTLNPNLNLTPALLAHGESRAGTGKIQDT